MPRLPRIKAEDSIFHIMVRSIKEVPLFIDSKDKDRYMSIIAGYQETYGFKVYGYCLMDNHAHLIIDVNGADISKIMHSINFKYAQIFNRKHNRHGHLFQDRFKSKIVKDERYLVTLSAYIHNNALDKKRYREFPEKYKYSSLGVYLGFREDPFGILDENYIMQLFGENKGRTRERYLKFVLICNDKNIRKEVEFVDEGTRYKSERKILVRDFNVEDIFVFLEDKTGVYRDKMHVKSRKGMTTARAFAALIMRHLCNYRCSDICRHLGNITQGQVSKLCSIALELMDNDERYRHIVTEFIGEFAANM